MDESDYGVHRTHCCVLHGCKYGDEDCPVVNKIIEQEYTCEYCDEVGIKDVESIKAILEFNDGKVIEELKYDQLIELQKFVTTFNSKYFTAVESSDPVDYLDSALLGRQLVDYICKQGIVKDLK